MHGDEDGMIPEEGNKNKRGDYAVPGDGDVSWGDNSLQGEDGTR